MLRSVDRAWCWWSTDGTADGACLPPAVGKHVLIFHFAANESDSPTRSGAATATTPVATESTHSALSAERGVRTTPAHCFEGQPDAPSCAPPATATAAAGRTVRTHFPVDVKAPVGREPQGSASRAAGAVCAVVATAATAVAVIAHAVRRIAAAAPPLPRTKRRPV